MGEIRPKCHLGVQGSCACIMVIEALAVSHSIVFSVISLIGGREHYESHYGFVADIIQFDYLIPLVVIQSLWVFSNLVALGAIKFTIPYLILPYSVLSVIAMVVVCFFLFFTVERMIRWEDWAWSGPVMIVFFTVFIVLQMYFSGIKVRCFRFLVKRKKAVQGTSEEKPAVADIDQFSSFSRRSTVIITDEMYEPPPVI